MGRGIVRGRAWESRETGKVGGNGRGEAKFGKGESSECLPIRPSIRTSMGYGRGTTGAMRLRVMGSEGRPGGGK